MPGFIDADSRKWWNIDHADLFMRQVEVRQIRRHGFRMNLLGAAVAKLKAELPFAPVFVNTVQGDDQRAGSPLLAFIFTERGMGICPKLIHGRQR